MKSLATSAALENSAVQWTLTRGTRNYSSHHLEAYVRCLKGVHIGRRWWWGEQITVLAGTTKRTCTTTLSSTTGRPRFTITHRQRLTLCFALAQIRQKTVGSSPPSSIARCFYRESEVRLTEMRDAPNGDVRLKAHPPPPWAMHLLRHWNADREGAEKSRGSR